MERLKSISDQYPNDPSWTYGIDPHKIAEEIMACLESDGTLVGQMREPSNSRDDVFDQFRDKVSHAIIDLIDPNDCQNGLVVYNLMCDDRSFREMWTREMFDRMYFKYHPQNVSWHDLYGEPEIV